MSRILVVGDAMLDVWLRTAARDRPDDRLAVRTVVDRTDNPGGAAHCAANVAGLGADTVLVCRGPVELDDVDVRCLPGPLATKTRIDDDLRLDEEIRTPVPAEDVLALVDDADVYVVSDYAKGVVSAELVAALVDRGPVVVDPGFGVPWTTYGGVTAITPATAELPEQWWVLAEELGIAHVVCTRGHRGLTWKGITIAGARAPEENTVGAGDSVVAALAVALAEGQAMAEAVRFAGHVGSRVVSQPGVTVAQRSWF